MNIIAHRGFWLEDYEQNTLQAFNRALDNKFGIELDVRDCNKQIVISHNPPDKKTEKFTNIFKSLSKNKNFKKVIFAINIKSEGLEKQIVDLLKRFKIVKNSFVFDMSIPTLYNFQKKYKKNIRVATRHSDLEQIPVLYKNSNWVWIDELKESWIKNNEIIAHVLRKKQVCLVSPELHNRAYKKKWQQLRKLPKSVLKKIYICTDFPHVADIFFHSIKEQ